MKLSSHKHKTLQWIKRSEHFYKNSINSETEKQTIIIEQMVFCNKWIEKKSKWTNWSDQISIKNKCLFKATTKSSKIKKKRRRSKEEMKCGLYLQWSERKEGERERTKRDLLQKLGNRARTSETATDGENRSVWDGTKLV